MYYFGTNRHEQKSKQTYSDILKISTQVLPNLSQHIKNLALFQQVEESVKCSNTIKDALNRLQSDNTCAAEAVKALKNILDGYRNESEYRNWLEAAEKRYNKSVPPVWFLANILHLRYAGRRVTPKELKDAKKLVEVYVIVARKH